MMTYDEARVTRTVRRIGVALAIVIVLLVALDIKMLSAEPMCNWSNPGADRYTGTMAEALNRFTIPQRDRDEIMYKYRHTLPSAHLYIEKGKVYGGPWSFSPLMLMHFGKGKLCWGVDRSSWAPGHVEEGEVYCSGTHCIGIPDVCGNVTQLFGMMVLPEGQSRPDDVAHVPEPSTCALLGIASMALLFTYKRRQP